MIDRHLDVNKKGQQKKGGTDQHVIPLSNFLGNSSGLGEKGRRDLLGHDLHTSLALVRPFIQGWFSSRKSVFVCDM